MSFKQFACLTLFYGILFTPCLSQQPKKMPSAFPIDTKINYVRTWEAKAPESNAATLKTKTVAEAKQTTIYLDGLGRVIETVVKQASPSKKDLVIPAVYNQFGNEEFQFLPFVSSTLQSGDLTDDGGFKLNPFQQDSVFNKTQYPGESFFYRNSIYESSPLNRIQKSYAPGNSWSGTKSGSSEKFVQQQYLINATADSVRQWTIDFAPTSLPTSAGYYSVGTLTKKIMTDEAGHNTVEYTDALGRIILQKRQLANSPGTAHVGWLCTYYVYDDLGNMRFILHPKAVESIRSTWTLTQGIADELCFRFEYDRRHHQIVKNDPGAGAVQMVYDKRDRVVMTQDSSLRSQGKWMIFEYDSQNRPCRSGLLTNSNSRSYHQNLADTSINYPNVSSNYEILTQIYYDDYSWVSATGTSLGSSLDVTNIYNNNYFFTTYNASPDYVVEPSQTFQTQGLVTGRKTKVLGTSNQYLYTVSFYDDHGRVIQTQSINITGGKDINTTQYDFSGKVLRSVAQKQKSGTNAQTHLVLSKVEYDHMDRVKRLWKNIDNATADQLIDSLQYNELGQLTKKFLGNNVDSLLYEYNIRGWLTSINKSFVAGGTGNYFGMELGYDKTTSVTGSTSFVNPQFNGNISGTIWKTLGDTTKRKYDFTYDNVNQLTGAAFLQNASGSGWDKSFIDYTVNNLTYDANGNILTMTQRGFKLTGSTLIDSLQYTYQSASNKLSSVLDNANDPSSKLGDFHYSGTKGSNDYAYDGNGNISYDNNKAISSFVYNYLNQVQQVNVTSKGSVQYIYDALGTKLQKITTDNSVSPTKTTTTTYLGELVFQNDSLQFIQHEEGRARWAFHRYLNGNSGYVFEYDFMEKDHLGNVRMVLTQQKDTAQYMATMESAYRTLENQLFLNIPQTAYSKSLVSGYPVDNTTSPNDSLVRLNGSGQKQGPSLFLKVMSGDKIDLAVKSFYHSGGTASSPNTILNDIVNSLAGGIVTVSAGSKGTLSELGDPNTSPVSTALQSFLSTNNPTPSGKPKAYLNWVLLDEQFKYVSSYPQSGAIQVGSADALNTLATTGIPISKNGYLYVWVSNETPGWDVFFDNLSVKHYSGPVLEETHYYPFGLTMAGISSKAIKSNYAENQLKFNSATRLNSDFDINLYETTYRSYDPQIGRFGQVDPLAIQSTFFSTYAFCENNPISKVDPSGLRSQQQAPRFDNIDQLLQYIKENGLSSFGDGFTMFEVGGGGSLSDPAFTKDLSEFKGELGIRFNFSGTGSQNGETDKDGYQVMSEFVMGTKWVSLGKFLVDWHNFLREEDAKFEEDKLEKIAPMVQLGVDVNATTWTAMSGLRGAGKTLGKIAKHGTILGIALSVTDATINIASGNGTWRDGATLVVAGATAAAMVLGGEVVVGVVAVGWDIFNLIF